MPTSSPTGSDSTWARAPHVRGVRHDPQGLHDRARTYLADYFAHLADESAVVVLLEDLHWADEGSLRWFEEVGDRLAAFRTGGDNPTVVVRA